MTPKPLSLVHDGIRERFRSDTRHHESHRRSRQFVHSDSFDKRANEESYCSLSWARRCKHSLVCWFCQKPIPLRVLILLVLICYPLLLVSNTPVPQQTIESGPPVVVGRRAFLRESSMPMGTPVFLHQSSMPRNVTETRRPRTVRIFDDFGLVKRINLRQYTFAEADEEEEDEVETRKIVLYGEESEEELCVPMYDWQTTSFPSCNNIHELDLSHNDDGQYSGIIASGWNRDVWDLKLSDNTRWALKTLRYELKFNKKYDNEQRVDAVISERLTSSPYIANIYGYCADTGVYDFAPEGTLKELYKDFNKQERLQIAVDISRALADLHTLGGGDLSPVIHADIDVRQFIKINGKFQLNDFNTARMLKWDRLRETTCPSWFAQTDDKNRAPEEKEYEENYCTEKVDVYSLGNIFYKFLTNESKYKHVNATEANELILDGDIPHLGDDIEKSKDPVDVALIHAMKRCLVLDPDERATSVEIAEYLANALEKAKKTSKAKGGKE